MSRLNCAWDRGIRSRRDRDTVGMVHEIRGDGYISAISRLYLGHFWPYLGYISAVSRRCLRVLRPHGDLERAGDEGGGHARYSLRGYERHRDVIISMSARNHLVISTHQHGIRASSVRNQRAISADDCAIYDLIHFSDRVA